MLHLTPQILEQIYELLRVTPPFKRWKLPEPDTLEFRTIKLPDDNHGEMWKRANGSLCLTVNPLRHKTLASATMTLAHEMVHLRLEAFKSREDHGPRFHKLADQVCRAHGFDRGQF